MKKILSLLSILIILIGCNEPTLETSPIYENNDLLTNQIQSDKMGFPNQNSCPPTTGNGVYDKTGSYNCHEYVRAALIGNNQVNLSTGQPIAVDFGPLYSHSTIQADDNFIRVCDEIYAEAIAHLPMSKDHSAIKVDGGKYAYSFPAPGKIWISISARNYGTACDYEYFASIEDIQIAGPVKIGNQYTFTLQNKSNHPYILTDASRWSYDVTKFTVSGTPSDTQITLVPNSGVNGNYSVSANLNTLATDSPTGDCAKGAIKIETATTYTPTRSKAFYIAPDCNGTLNGGALNTFNSVSKFTTHAVVMNEGPWTWVKTSGNATWSTSNGGKEMSFSISSGYVTFNAYNSGCNRTMTFYGY
uniref:hypothetical protein n=2 Tax=Roseivirga sp. TaxID=1964215 RepID=UPI0040482870